MCLKTLLLSSLCAVSAFAQPGILTKELLVQYTPEWKGERFADGRPKVPDGILKRMKSVTLEKAMRPFANPMNTCVVEVRLNSKPNLKLCDPRTSDTLSFT